MRHFFTVVAALAAFPLTVHAATELSFEAPATVPSGGTAEIVVVARPTESINAVSGTVVYDPSLLTVTSLTDADSAVRNWMVYPAAKDGTIAFAGIIPGGVGPGFGDGVELLRFTVRSEREGTATLGLRDAEVRLNQPDGRADTVTVVPGVLAVRTDASPVTVPSASVRDAEVLLRLVSEPSLHDGAWALEFDIRGTEGSAHKVLLRERLLGLPAADREVVSPARLEDQRRLSILEVRMADGTFVGHIVPAPLWIAWAMLTALLLIAVTLIWRRYNRH